MHKLSRLWQNPITLPVYLPFFLVSFWRGMLIPILPVYATSFDVSYWQVGVLLGATEVGLLIGDAIAGGLMNRIGQRRTLIFGAGTAVFATSPLYFAPNIWVAFVFLLISGLCVALFQVANHLYLAEMVTVDNRGKVIAGLGGVSRLGMFAGPAFAGAVAGAFSLRVPFLITAAIALIVVAILYTYVPDSIQTTTPHKPHNIFQVIRQHATLLTASGVAVLCAQMVRAGRRVAIPLFAAEVLQLDVQSIGLIVSIASAVDMTLFPIAGLLMDNWGRKWSIVPSFIMQGVFLMLVPFTTSFVSLLVVACLVSFGNGLSSGTMMTVGADLSPAGNKGEFLSAWRFIGDTGFALGPNIVGVVADIFVLGTAVLVVGGAGVLAGGIFAAFVPETLRITSKPALENQSAD